MDFGPRFIMLTNKITNVCTFIAIGCILAMVFGRFAESWSQNHTGDYDFLLYGTLLSITVVYLLRGLFHHRKEEKALLSLNRGEFDLVTALLFGLVLVFGVNSRFEWVQFLHIIFTGLAIISASVGLVSYYKEGVSLHGAIMGVCSSGALFLFAYLGNDLTTAEGEIIVLSNICFNILYFLIVNRI